MTQLFDLHSLLRRLYGSTFMHWINFQGATYPPNGRLDTIHCIKPQVFRALDNQERENISVQGYG